VTHFYKEVKDISKDDIILNILERIVKTEIKPQVIIFFNSIPELRQFYNMIKKEKKRFVTNDATASNSGKYNLKVDYIHGLCT
jgi:hypothetical protein